MGAPPLTEICTSLSRRFPLYSAVEAWNPFRMTTAVTVDGSNETSSHWPCSVGEPSCQLVLRLPSIASCGPYLAVSASAMDEAEAPVSLSGLPRIGAGVGLAGCD